MSSAKKTHKQNLQYLQIAAVTMAISCSTDVRWQTPDPLYRAFFTGPGAEKSDSRISVRLVLGKMPDLSRLQKLFDTRESWSLYGDARGYWISFHPDLYPHPIWIARFDRQANRAIIYCGPFLQKTAGKNKIDLFNPIGYPLDQLLLMYHLSYRNGFLMHAAGIDLAGRGLIFPGASGAGKSTFAQLLAAAKIGQLLSDERIIVREIDGVIQAFGTPWVGSENIAGNGCAPLAGMFFLKHGECNQLRVLTAENALERLLPILSIPWYNLEVMSRIIAFAKRLLAKIPAYEMSFKPDSSAVDFFLKFLTQINCKVPARGDKSLR